MASVRSNTGASTVIVVVYNKLIQGLVQRSVGAIGAKARVKSSEGSSPVLTLATAPPLEHTGGCAHRPLLQLAGWCNFKTRSHDFGGLVSN